MDSEDEWLEESVKDRKARHERYGSIAAEKVPKSTSLQEQAKALAEPLAQIEEAYMVFAKNRPDRGQDGDHQYAARWDSSSRKRAREETEEDESLEDDEVSEEERRRREKKRQRRETRQREQDMDDYDEALQKLSAARLVMDRRLAVIDVAHRYNWDVAQRFQDKRQPVKDKDLKAALEESNKAADIKKEKAKKDKRSRARARYRENYSPRKRSRFPSRRASSPRSYGYARGRSYNDHPRYGSSNRRGLKERERQGCFDCGDRSHRIKDCPNRKK